MLRDRCRPRHVCSFLRALTWLLLSLLAAGPRSAKAGWEGGYWALVHEAVLEIESVSVAPDGQGGMLVAALDPNLVAGKIRISRVDHVGTELWGEGGTVLPWPYGATAQTGPIGVAPDGGGGAYCVTNEVWGTGNYLVVTHLTPTGAYDWVCYVADMGQPGGYTPLHAEIEATGDGEVIVGWIHAVVGQFKLKLARVGGGSVLWSVDILPGLQTDPYGANWHMTSDGFDGVLVNYEYQPPGQGVGWYAQRISGSGAALYGVNGHRLLGRMDKRCAMAPDGTGGAYVATRDAINHQVAAQHLNASGNETWTVGGVTALPYEGDPLLCTDGQGGAILAVGSNQDIYAQHLDLYGNLLWGTNGVVAAGLAGWQDLTSLVWDGFNGAILGYVDWYFANDGENRCPSGVRLGWFGEKIWEAVGLWLSGYNDDLEPYAVRAVADGSGGALYAWNEQYDPIGANFVYGVGVNAKGKAPYPEVSYVWPDGLAPGATSPVFIYGDYLEASQAFAMKQGASTSVPVTDNQFLGYNLIAGNLALGSAPSGAYDCVAAVNGVPRDTLAAALGVGQALPDVQDLPMDLVTYSIAQPGESLRKVAIDANGVIHVVWVEYGDYAYKLMYARGDANGWFSPPYILMDTTTEIAEPCITVGADDWSHIAFVLRDPYDPLLYYIRSDPNGLDHYHYSQGNGQPKWNPAVTTTGDGEVHFVYEEGPEASTSLFYTRRVGYGFLTPVDVNAGQNAHWPDLTAFDANGLILVYSRDLWLPGFREICYQHYAPGGGWESPVSLHWSNFNCSPSVAWDRTDRVLFSWIVDNTGADGLLHTCLMEDGVLGPVRWRAGERDAIRTGVAASGPGKFHLFTEEYSGAFPVLMNLRMGDGNVFFPKRRLNSCDLVDFPGFAVEYGGQGVFAFWRNDETPETPLYQWLSFGGTPEEVRPGELAAAMLGPLAHPNPGRSETTISFTLPDGASADLAIFDVGGRRVRTLLQGTVEGGERSLLWDGRDDAGRQVSSGSYMVRLQWGDQCQARKLVLLK